MQKLVCCFDNLQQAVIGDGGVSGQASDPVGQAIVRLSHVGATCASTVAPKNPGTLRDEASSDAGCPQQRRPASLRLFLYLNPFWGSVTGFAIGEKLHQKISNVAFHNLQEAVTSVNAVTTARKAGATGFLARAKRPRRGWSNCRGTCRTNRCDKH